MVHTDHGLQYCAKTFLELIRKYELIRSMSRKGNCWDNAVAESFFTTFKKQAIHGYKLKTKDHMRTEIFAYIETYYNRVRRHSANGWVSPVAFEAPPNQSCEALALH
jgi:putative transposase